MVSAASGAGERAHAGYVQAVIIIIIVIIVVIIIITLGCLQQRPC